MDKKFTIKHDNSEFEEFLNKIIQSLRDTGLSEDEIEQEVNRSPSKEFKKFLKDFNSALDRIIGK